MTGRTISTRWSFDSRPPGKNAGCDHETLSASSKSFKVSRRGEQKRAARGKNRHESSAEARGSSAGLSGGQRAKDSRGQCAKGQKSQKRPTPSWRRVAAVNRLFTQVRHTSSWLGKSYLKNNSRSFEIVVSLLESPVPVSGFCEDLRTGETFFG